MTTRGKGAFRGYQRYVGLGLQLPATILLGCLLGWWADGRLGTQPWLLIAGAAVGMVVGFTMFLTTVLQAEKETLERERKDEEG